jgi:hypothetical protein
MNQKHMDGIISETQHNINIKGCGQYMEGCQVLLGTEEQPKPPGFWKLS